jgi:hypothetical protein
MTIQNPYGSISTERKLDGDPVKGGVSEKKFIKPEVWNQQQSRILIFMTILE